MMKRRTVLGLATIAAIMIVGVNAVAYLQARAMTRFADSGSRTRPPEELNVLGTARTVLTGVNVPRPRNGATPARLGLQFETHRITTTRGDVLDAWHIPVPSAATLVLVFHGYASSKSALIPIASALHELGHAALLVDFHGSGESSGDGTSLGYLEADDVAAAADYAKRAWPSQTLVFYGFSMGGAAVLRAIDAAGARPERIIVEATFDTLLNTAKSRFRAMGLPPTPFAELLLFWGGVQWEFDPFTLNPIDYARSVRCPALILHGERDARVPPSQAQALQRAMPGARLVLFPGARHALLARQQPEQWKTEVGAFLASAER